MINCIQQFYVNVITYLSASYSRRWFSVRKPWLGEPNPNLYLLLHSSEDSMCSIHLVQRLYETAESVTHYHKCENGLLPLSAEPLTGKNSDMIRTAEKNFHNYSFSKQCIIVTS